MMRGITMVDLVPSIFGLVGVVIGGVISYKVQTKHQQDIEKRNDKRQKYIAYNQFLLNDGESSPLTIYPHPGAEGDFEWEIYRQGPRRILYDNLHLFDKDIVENVLMIDLAGERAEVMGVEPGDIGEICYRYTQIRKMIIQGYKNSL